MSLTRYATGLFREPLVHFVLIAGVVFALDYAVLGLREDPREIVVDAATYEELLDIFKEGKGRLPSESEMGTILLKWSENEVLYREAQRMGLDKGDDMIRSRLVLKLRNILFGNVVTPTPTEQDLRDWLEANRARYDRPALLDVEQVALEEAATEDDAQQLATQASEGSLAPELANRVRRYRGRPAIALSAVFNDDDVQRLVSGAPGAWKPVRSSAGWHIARVTGITPGVAAEYENIRGKLAEDWKKESQQRELAQALQAIVRDYDIRLDLDAERVRDSLGSPALANRAKAR